MKPNSWRKFPRLALDLAVTCPVTQPLIAQAAAETLSAAGKYADRKRGSGDIAIRCAAANLGYEPVVFESFGGIERGGMGLFSFICSKVDQQQQSRIGEAKRLCLARFSFDLQRGLYGALNAHRVVHSGDVGGTDPIEAFLQLCSG